MISARYSKTRSRHARLGALVWAALVPLGALAAQEAAPPPAPPPPAEAADPAPAQPAVVSEAQRLREQVTFDVVRLFGVEGKTLVEIYSRIPTNVLTFTESDGRWQTSLAFDLAVKSGDSVVLRDSWTRNKSVADRRMLDSPRVYFVETHAFLLQPGTYRLEGAISDAAGKELGSLRQTVEAPADNPPASDLLLASRIGADTTSALREGYDPVRKNRLVLNPTPDGVFSTATSPLVFFYLEFENVQAEPLALVRVLRFRAQGSDQIVKEVRAPKTYQPGWTVDFAAVNVAGLKEGAYTLEVAWEAPEGGTLPEAYRDLARSKDFVVVREKLPPTPVAEVASDEGLSDTTPAGGPADTAPVGGPPPVDHYRGYTEAQLDSVFDLLDVLFDHRQRQVYRGLKPEGKRSFLNQFWARQDETPGTPENPFYDEVQERLTTVQSKFRSPVQTGYETARGRIWLKNGKPDKLIQRMLEAGFSAPYEIWIYYATGYRYFFLDEFRNGRYLLLVSTDPEEQGRPDWEERVTTEAAEEFLRE